MNEVINVFVADATDFPEFGQTLPVRKSFNWLTDVVRFDSGIEQRNQIISSPIRSWMLNWSIMNQGVRDKLIELFQRVRGRYETFLYEDDEDEDGSCAFSQTKYNITAVSAGDETFTIAGDHTTTFIAGFKFQVYESTGNDGQWVVSSSTYIGGNTVITVIGNVINAVADGWIVWSEFQLFHTYYSGESESWVETKKDIQPTEIAVTQTVTAHTEGVDYDLTDYEDGRVIYKANLSPVAYNIKTATAGAAGVGTFVIDEDITGHFQVGDKFTIKDSTGNDATYTIASIAFGADTTITTDEAIPNGTDDGYLAEYISCTYKFYFRVRFDFDAHLDVMNFTDLWTAPEVRITEVKYA